MVIFNSYFDNYQRLFTRYPSLVDPTIFLNRPQTRWCPQPVRVNKLVVRNHGKYVICMSYIYISTKNLCQYVYTLNQSDMGFINARTKKNRDESRGHHWAPCRAHRAHRAVPTDPRLESQEVPGRGSANSMTGLGDGG